MRQHSVNNTVLADASINNDVLTARPVHVIHQDGTTETVYLMQIPTAHKKRFTEHITTWYFIIGTLALSLSVILSLRQIKNGNG